MLMHNATWYAHRQIIGFRKDPMVCPWFGYLYELPLKNIIYSVDYDLIEI